MDSGKIGFIPRVHVPYLWLKKGKRRCPFVVDSFNLAISLLGERELSAHLPFLYYGKSSGLESAHLPA